MNTIIVVNQFFQESLVLLQHFIAHVRDVVEECFILHLEHTNFG